MRSILVTDDSLAPLMIRIALGIAIFPHGAQKLFGWFGGSGFGGTLDTFQQYFGVPAFLTVLVIFAELFGSIGLVVGFLTRVAAAGIGAVMIGAVALAHWQNGFFMNWSGDTSGEGFEYHILAIGMAIALILAGGGAASVDRKIAPKL